MQTAPTRSQSVAQGLRRIERVGKSFREFSPSELRAVMRDSADPTIRTLARFYLSLLTRKPTRA